GGAGRRRAVVLAVPGEDVRSDRAGVIGYSAETRYR
ncbi:MAG: hypothetical protein QOF11_2543, partial [Chloroflexota bacterium]|nr:hypothetical protein [Chloroflexota bacterium]